MPCSYRIPHRSLSSDCRRSEIGLSCSEDEKWGSASFVTSQIPCSPTKGVCCVMRKTVTRVTAVEQSAEPHYSPDTFTWCIVDDYFNSLVLAFF